MSPIAIEIAVVVLACSTTAALMLWLWRDRQSAERDTGAVFIAIALAVGGLVVLALTDEPWGVYAASGLVAAALGFPVAALWRKLTGRR